MIEEERIEVVGRAIHREAATHSWEYDDCRLCPDAAREALGLLNEPDGVEQARKRDAAA